MISRAKLRVFLKPLLTAVCAYEHIGGDLNDKIRSEVQQKLDNLWETIMQIDLRKSNAIVSQKPGPS